MKILLITFYYGITASGVISKRVVDALAEKGHEIVVLTSSSALSTESKSKVKFFYIPSLTDSCSLLARFFSRLQSQKFLSIYHYFWVKRTYNKANSVIESLRPDIIYCRTSPIEACYVGEKLGSLYNIPILQHFADPIPAPVEYLPESRRRSVLIKRVKRIIEAANMVSFGNERMLSYVQEQINLPFFNKAFVSPDMASGSNIHYEIASSNKERTVLTYFGNIYGGRNPSNLLNALLHLYNKGMKIEMRIYSTVMPSLLNKYPFIISKTVTSDIQHALCEADILVDIDGDDTEPVFISSKLKDYLLVNRPILSITPKNSPSCAILSNIVTARVVVNDQVEIENAIMYFISSMFSDADYSDRQPIIDYFSPQNVSNEIEKRLKSLLVK